ncbi:MAG: hypothetical protein U9R54_10135 [Bacteroidota bacterium]|nr:hypothetical protein [Bacteroidota bacterium]
MIFKALKSNSPLVIFYYILLSILLWLFTFINYRSIEIIFTSNQMPFYNVIIGWINQGSLFSLIISLVMIIIQGFLLIRINQKHIIINTSTYFPAIIYMLIVSSNLSYQQLNPMVFANFFLIFVIDYIYSIYKGDYILNKLYLIGFFVALASLFYFPYIFLLVFIWISLLIFKPFSGREWFVPILGLLTPYLFLFVYLFLNDDVNYLVEAIENFSFEFSIIVPSLPYIIFYSFFSLLLVVASISTARRVTMKKIKVRKYFNINWWVFILGIVLFLFVTNVSYEILYLIAIPSSFFITEYFYNIRKNIY